MKSLRKIKKFIVRFWQEIIIAIVLSVFFLSTSSFLYLSQSYSSDPASQADFVKWGSPDETANYIFAKLYAQEGRIYLEENYNKEVDDIMRPRSFRSDHGIMKPVSFLGIILIYGKIASFFSYKIIPYLTPLIASIGLIYFYLLVRELFGKQNAFFSTIIASVFPVLIYYTARSMFHNVLFCMLFIVFLYYAYIMGKDSMKIKRLKDLKTWAFIKNYVFAILAGGFFGLAVMTRTSELLWLAPLLLLLWVFNIRRVGFFKLLLFLVATVLALSPMFVQNKALYGSYFFGGYPQMNQSIQTLASASTDIVSSGISGETSFLKDSLKTIKNTIFHFGYDAEQSRAMFKSYFINMFPYIYYPALLGIIYYFIRSKHNKYRQWVYLLGLSVISFILVVYYGSWEFHDNPDAEAVTIGNSYTRYWLPIYLGAIPFLTLLMMKLTRVFCKFTRGEWRDREDDSEENKEYEKQGLFAFHDDKIFCRNFLRVILLVAIIFISIKFVLYGSEEGLVVTMQKSRSAEEEWTKVLNLTENNSAIVTRYHDKLFFPERKVIVGLFDDIAMNDKYSRLAKHLPLYYYNFSLADADIRYLNERRLAESDLQIELVEKINDTFSLYRLSPAERTD